jgi:hypothetical protein
MRDIFATGSPYLFAVSLRRWPVTNHLRAKTLFTR